MKTTANTSLFILSLLLACNLFFSSCDKNNDEPGPGMAPEPIIATLSMFDSNGTLNYSQSFEYNPQRRVIKIEEDAATYSTFEYSASKIVMKDYMDGKLEETSVMNLNEMGWCTSLSLGDIYTLETYQYDAYGNLISSFTEDETWTFTRTYTLYEGNTVSIVSEEKSKTAKSATVNEPNLIMRSSLRTNPIKRLLPENRLKSAAANYTEKTEYEFFKDKKNTIGLQNMGVYFLGQQDTNPTRQETNTTDVGTQYEQSQTITYTYEFDPKNRITKQTSSDGDYLVFTYVD